MPDLWFDVDVALAEVPVNISPLLDDTDFKSIEAAVVYDAAGMALKWHFVTTAGAMTETAVTPTSGGVHDWTDQGTSGLYALEVPASGGTIDNDTEGFGWFTGVVTGVVPWRGPVCGFRAAAINDAFIDSDTLIDNADNALLYESTIGTATSQTEFIMDVAFAVDDTWIGNACSLEDVSTGEIYSGNVWISDSVQTTESLHINATFPVTVVAGDKIRIYAGQHPTYALTTYDPPTRTEATADKTEILARVLKDFQLALRSDAGPTNDNAAELAAINEDIDGGGAGSYDPTTDSLEVNALTTQMTESYAADGVAPTPAQSLFLIQQMLTEFAISGVTLTAKKLDGVTTALTMTLDDDSNPTSSTRSG